MTHCVCWTFYAGSDLEGKVRRSFVSISQFTMLCKIQSYRLVLFGDPQPNDQIYEL